MSTPQTSATRDPSQIPYASDSIFNLPIGSGAQWMYNAQLASSNVVINAAGNWNENIWAGTASDPLVTVTGSDGTTAQIYIPSGAAPSNNTDATFTVDDTVSHTWWNVTAFNWTGSNTASAANVQGESDYGDGLGMQGSNWDEGVGTIRASDLAAGSIDHMMRVEMSTDMLDANGGQMVPYSWPQSGMDGFALSGQGGNAYSGTVPYGVTVGIPQGAAEPADVQANAGADMLWKALQNHGAMIRDSAGSGNNVTFQTDQNVDYSNPLIQGMMQYGAEIMAATQILANQGPHSVNGGGTPIVPLDPPLSDDPNASPGSGSTGSGPTGSGSTGTSTPTVLTPTSGGSIKDAAGNTWTLTSAGVIDENGTAVPGGGTSAFTIVNGVDYGQDGGSKAWYTYSNGTWTAASAPPGVSVPTGSADTLTLRVCEDAYQGDAHFIVSVDGKQVGGTMTASALYSSGDANVFTLTGNWGSGAHDVQPTFINDSYGGSATADRNLYANSIGYDGVTYSNTAAALMSNGTENFTVGGATPADTPPADTLTLHLAEDAYNGNAQFKLSIDGKVISTPQEVTALHSAGAWQDLSFAGNFGAGTHTVGVQFTSDSYGGTAATDRNLYVNGVDLNDTHYGSGVTALMSNGTASFSITTTH